MTELLTLSEIEELQKNKSEIVKSRKDRYNKEFVDKFITAVNDSIKVNITSGYSYFSIEYLLKILYPIENLNF